MIRAPSQGQRHDRSKSGSFGRRRGALNQEGVDRLLLGLRIAWCLIILYGEVWAFTGAVHGCKWPSDFRYEVGQSESVTG